MAHPFSPSDSARPSTRDELVASFFKRTTKSPAMKLVDSTTTDVVVVPLVTTIREPCGIANPPAAPVQVKVGLLSDPRYGPAILHFNVPQLESLIAPVK